MGRRRKKNKHLPERVYLHGKRYRYAHPDGSYTSLGITYSEMLVTLARLQLDPGELVTLRDVMDHFELYELPKRATSTHANLKRQLQLLRKTFGHMLPDQVKPHHIYEYMDLRPQVSGNREVALLSAVYRLAIRKGSASGNPCKMVSRNTERPRERYVTDAEARAVQALAPAAVRLAMEIAMVTGLDLGVILRLQLSDIRDGVLHARRTKTGRKVSFNVTGRLAAAIDEARGLRRRHGIPLATAYLLPNSRGLPYTVDGFETVWTRVMASFIQGGGERFQFRDLRAKAASDSASSAEAAARLGNSEPVAHRVYRRKPSPQDPL